MVSFKMAGVLVGALGLSLAGASLSPAWSQSKGAPATPVTQDQLNAAAGDSK